MKFSEIVTEAPRQKGMTQDPVGVIEYMHKEYTSRRTTKIPTKLGREMCNQAVQEAVARWNAAGTGDAHDVPFPYDSDFNLSSKLGAISKVVTGGGHKGPFDRGLIKSPVFAKYINAVQALAETSAAAEMYGKFVYGLIIDLWGWNTALTRTDKEFMPTDDERFHLEMAMKALGAKVGKTK